MFTDIVDSTQLTEALGDEQWSRLLRQHREAVRRAFVARGGQEVATQGDGFLARFDSPAHAVLCAVDIQRDVSERQKGDAIVPRVRIGIHAGEAVEDDGDLVGRVVNLAARVAGEAEAGEILVTEPVAEPFALSLPGYPLSKYMRRFLDLGQPIHFIHYRREEEAVADALTPPPVLPGFRAAWSMAGNG